MLHINISEHYLGLWSKFHEDFPLQWNNNEPEHISVALSDLDILRKILRKQIIISREMRLVTWETTQVLVNFEKYCILWVPAIQLPLNWFTVVNAK